MCVFGVGFMKIGVFLTFEPKNEDAYNGDDFCFLEDGKHSRTDTTGFLTGNRNRSLYIRQARLLNHLSKQLAAQGICPLEIPQTKNDGKCCCLLDVFMISFRRNIIVSVCLLYDPSKRIAVKQLRTICLHTGRK